MKDIEKALHQASTGSEEELRLLVHHTSPKVISNLLLNDNLSEELEIIIANRKNLSTDVLEDLYHNLRWKDSYRVMLALCKNRKTPQKIESYTCRRAVCRCSEALLIQRIGLVSLLCSV